MDPNMKFSTYEIFWHHPFDYVAKTCYMILHHESFLLLSL